MNGSSFDLNDKEFEKIKSLSKKITKKDLLLIWQFALNNLEKIDIIKNQYQFVEMFLIRLLYLKKILKNETNENNQEFNQDLSPKSSILKSSKIQNQDETINQLKNVEQEEKIVDTPDVKNEENYLEIKVLKIL